MQTDLSMQSWLDHLRNWMPIKGVIHVGAGNGQQAAARYSEWAVPGAMFIEADEAQQEKLSAALGGRPGWDARIALVSDREGETDFYWASNPNENGLFNPEDLTGLWRNLKTKEQRRLQSITLEKLLQDANTVQESFNWGVIDCLPALTILRGAGKYLEAWDAVIARVILDQSQTAGQGSDKAELDAFLSSRGFHCVAVQEERQPVVGSALYVRDWKALLQMRLSEQVGIAENQHAQMQQLTLALEEHGRLVVERQQQLQEAAQARDAQAKLAGERQAQVDELTKARDEQARLAAERQQQLQEAMQACDAQAKLASERQVQVDKVTTSLANLEQQVATLNKEKTDLTAANDSQIRQIAQRNAELEQLETLSRQKEARIAQLEATLTETEHRQRLLDQEMSKAEAQLNLIKDLLLREPGL